MNTRIATFLSKLLVLVVLLIAANCSDSPKEPAEEELPKATYASDIIPFSGTGI